MKVPEELSRGRLRWWLLITLIVLPAISAASVLVVLNSPVFPDAAVALAAGAALVSVVASVLSVRATVLLDDSKEQ